MSTAAPTSRRYELGLLGFPVAHSASPAMHAAALAASDLAGTYELWAVPDVASLDHHLARLRAGLVTGLNVTIPWKIAAAERCDLLVGEAAIIGAANTLLAAEDGRIIGHNTDVAGLATSVRESFQSHVFSDAIVTVIGAGGAGRSAILAAELLGAREIRVFNRTFDRAQRVTETLGRGVAVRDFDAALAGTNLVLQASALGFDLSQPETDTLAATLVRPLSGVASGACVYDLVYTPSPTATMIAAQRCGHATSDGLGMLVHQAARAFAIWTGHTPDTTPMWAAARAHLAARAS